MGMDLCNEQASTLWFSLSGWWLTLIVAEDFGWLPEGTMLARSNHSDDEPRCEWNGAYDTNDGQEVSADDAEHLADALERAIAAEDFTQRVQACDKIRQSREAELSMANHGDDSPAPVRPLFHDSELSEYREGSFVIE
ncbi:MAG TPA: hypothetical protein VHV08_05655 [Pirellulales bacterium]|jgi:hypothetical protein|nr:hypothetical protein [Pirellulales bacterium]